MVTPFKKRNADDAEKAGMKKIKKMQFCSDPLHPR